MIILQLSIHIHEFIICFSISRRQAMGDYLYHNLAATDGSGERALNQILKPGAWARSPLRHRLPKIDSSIPIHFIYGDNDWMDATVSTYRTWQPICNYDVFSRRVSSVCRRLLRWIRLDPSINFFSRNFEIEAEKLLLDTSTLFLYNFSCLCDCLSWSLTHPRPKE